jgi:hypothetical protein
MNLALWIIAGLLAAVFAVASVSKVEMPKERLVAAPGGELVKGFSAGGIKALGALDLLAAVGLILPAALDIVPVLVPLAATGVALLMVGAVITRLRYGGAKAIPVDLIYLVLAGIVAWGRFGPLPF